LVKLNHSGERESSNQLSAPVGLSVLTGGGVHAKGSAGDDIAGHPRQPQSPANGRGSQTRASPALLVTRAAIHCAHESRTTAAS